MRHALLYSCAIALALSTPVLAQSVQPLPAAAEASQSGIEDIVVTAQRRQESAQDVPIAITAISASQIAAGGVLRTNDLPKLTPGLLINRENSAPQIFLRGVGTPNSVPGFETAVATYVDGVYMPTPYAASFSLGDVERIEVIKGPQGTLFGRNATAGVIQVITRDPDQDASLDASLGYGKYNTVEAGAYGKAPISSEVAIGLSVNWREQYDGWGHNVVTGQDTQKGREFSTRGKLIFTPGTDTTIKLSADYSNTRSDIGSIAHVVPPTRTLDGRPPLGLYDSSHDFEPYNTAEQYGFSLFAEHQLSNVTITSITGYRNFKGLLQIDADQNYLPQTRSTINFNVKSISEELRIASASDSPFQWMIGGYYYGNTTEIPNFLTFANLGATKLFVISEQKVRSWAGFAQASLRLGEATTLTAGGRYTTDRKRFVGFREVNNVRTTRAPSTQTDNEPSFRLSIDHKLGENLMVYASYNRSFRGGGFNTLGPLDPAVKAEIINAYEAGFKSDLLDRHLRVNGAIFEYKFKNIQLQQSLNNVPLTFNAAAARVRGAELDITAEPVRNLVLRAGMSYLDGKYTSFPGAPRFVPGPVAGAVIVPIDGKGLRTLRTPEFTGTFAVDYEIPSAIGTFRLSSNLYHTSSFFADAGNSYRANGYDVVNASIGWQSLSKGQELILWSRNLFGEKYCDRVQASAAGYSCGGAEPFTFGVTAKLHL